MTLTCRKAIFPPLISHGRYYLIVPNNPIPHSIVRFFTLAHEIAHNLVQPHNSEHEFYFSAICEAHIMQFGKLLAGT